MEAIEHEIASCHALIVLIGQQWLTVVAEDGRRRLDDPHDFVRLEIATALKRKALVIPAVVGGASMPSADSLPEDLQALTRRQALHVTDQDWDHDVERLVQVLEKALGASPAKDRPTVSAVESEGIPSPTLPPPPPSEPVPSQGVGEPQSAPLNLATLVGRWQLKESQAVVQIMGFIDLYPNYQFQVSVQGLVAIKGLWTYNPLMGTLEFRGQNLYGVGIPG